MNDRNHYLEKYLLTSSDCVNSIRSDPALLSTITIISKASKDCLEKGGKLLFAGNGGSAADCQHMAGEYVSRFMFDRSALAAIALTTDTSILTAIGNDYGFEDLFSRQLHGLARKGDILYVYSTSGNSPNCLKAISTAKDLGVLTVGMTGARGGKMDEHCDFLIRIPSTSTPHIQEGHIIVGHAICALVEQMIFADHSPN